MKFTNTQVFNIENAIRGLRNPLESWDKSDSDFGLKSFEYCDSDYEIAEKWQKKYYDFDFEDEYGKWYEKTEEYAEWLRKNGVLKSSDDCCEYAFLGPNDIDLAHRMIKAGSADRKFLRQIFVSVDITAPLYWWKEADTYKVGTVANSTSTMHKLATTPITIDCFEIDDYEPELIFESGIDDHGDTPYNYSIPIKDVVGDYEKHFYYMETIIGFLESLRQKYLETKDKRYWKELIRWLPEGWLQTRTWTANYEVLRNIYFQR